MASLKKRNGTYYIVFTRRVEGKVQQKLFSLGVKRKPQAERLRIRYEERYHLGEIDPFNGWNPKTEIEAERRDLPSGTTLAEMADRFLQARSHVRARTRTGYEGQFRLLQEQLGRTMPVNLIKESDVRAYCFRPDLSTASQTTYLRFCKMFFKWLYEEGHVPTDICKRIRYPKRADRTSDKTINEAELLKIFAAFRQQQQDHREADEKRGLYPWFEPLIATVFYAGLRAREIVELAWDKVNLKDGLIYITNTKSGRERVIPMRAALRPYLEGWYEQQGCPSHGLVFYQSRQGDWQVPLNSQHVSKTFKRYARAADMPDSVNLHGLRHSCATELLRLGMGINEVATILGHSSIEVTRIYEHLNERDLKRKMQQLGI